MQSNASLYMQYEPTIEELRHKYEVAMKEKMLVRLEKERLQARTEALEAQVCSALLCTSASVERHRLSPCNLQFALSPYVPIRMHPILLSTLGIWALSVVPKLMDASIRAAAPVHCPCYAHPQQLLH